MHIGAHCYRRSLALIASLLAIPVTVFAQDLPSPAQQEINPQSGKASNQRSERSEQQELQKAIDDAANDRAALVRNLEEFLKVYPQSQQRPQIYRAIVEASLKVDDYPRASEYAERLVALRPDDASINILAIQLLERYGDVAGWRRAISYCTRVYQQVQSTKIADKSPRVSAESWENDKKRDESSVLLVRARLYQKLNDLADAQKDYETSYAFFLQLAPPRN